MAFVPERWKIIWKDSARKELSKLGRTAQKDILDYLRERIATASDPTVFGKPLRYGLKGQWRYRVGDYRILCEIHEQQLVVLVLSAGHRKDIYG